MRVFQSRETRFKLEAWQVVIFNLKRKTRYIAK